MITKRKDKSLLQNTYFISGVFLSTLVFALISGLLYTTGLIDIGLEDKTYANSLSPRKSGPNWYTPPIADPNGADQTAPIVSFVKPVDNSTVDSSSKVGSYYIVPVELAASDNDRIAHIALYVNNVLDGLLYYNATTYNATVRIPNQAGTYIIKAIAYDYNGNPGEESVSITVPRRGK